MTIIITIVCLFSPSLCEIIGLLPIAKGKREKKKKKKKKKTDNGLIVFHSGDYQSYKLAKKSVI